MFASDGRSMRERREAMVERLVRGGTVRSDRVADALRAVPRHRFVPERVRDRAYRDAPLDIGEGQTISAPHMVAMMLEALEPRPGHRVLEVGGGSGYHAAVAAHLVAPDGHVWTVERIPELADGARRHLEAAGVADHVTVVVGDGSGGWSDHAPYDRIWVACAAPDVPPPLVDQLAAPGAMLVPVGSRASQKLLLVDRDPNGDVVREQLASVRFVPLVGRHGFPG